MTPLRNVQTVHVRWRLKWVSFVVSPTGATGVTMAVEQGFEKWIMKGGK